MSGGGGTASEVRSKKKRLSQRRPHRFFGEVVFVTTFFFLLCPFPSTRPAPPLTPHPACDAPRRGGLLVTQVVFHLKMYLVHLWEEVDEKEEGDMDVSP